MKEAVKMAAEALKRSKLVRVTLVTTRSAARALKGRRRA